MPETKKNNNSIRVIFSVTGLLLLLYSVFVYTRSNLNLGIVLPAVFGVPLLAYGILANPIDGFSRAGAGRAIRLVFSGIYIAAAGVMVVISVIAASAANTRPPPGADAIIVLGAGIRGEQVTISLRNRLDAAAEYYADNREALIVVSGGRGPREAVSEARAMEKYLVEKAGIPAEHIIKEDRSASTSENFLYTKAILDGIYDEGYRVVYVTNGFHILRSGIIAEKLGLDAQGLAAPTPPYIALSSYMRESVALLYTFVFGV